MAELRQLVDDPSISDDDIVLRLVRPDTIAYGPPPRVKSNAFQEQPAHVAAENGLAASCMSVALESAWLEASGKIGDLLFSRSYGIVRMPVGGLRALQKVTSEDQPQGVMRDPIHEQPWHAVVWDLSGKQTKGTMKALSELAHDWLYLPAVNV